MERPLRDIVSGCIDSNTKVKQIMSSLNKPSVMVIDDDQSIREILEAILKRGFLVYTAGDGESGFQIIRKNRPDVIFLDVNLPGISGVDLLPKIIEENSDAVCIMMSAYHNKKVVNNCLTIGAYDFITKEFDYEVTFQLANNALKSRDEGGCERKE